MAHDVFISHSTKDKSIADAVCAVLESRNIRCWIAPRDVPPGYSFPAAIDDAINSCEIMVLVLSINVNDSTYVEKEVRVAVDSGRIIIPFRIEDFKLSKSLNLLVGNIHWMDALTPPLKKHLTILSDKVHAVLHPAINNETNSLESMESSPASPYLVKTTIKTENQLGKGWRDRLKNPKVIIPIITVFVLVVVLLTFRLWYLRDKESFTNQDQSYSFQYQNNRDAFLGALPWLRWIVYDPTDYDPYQNKDASEASIRKDIKVLRQYGFDGLITMTSKGNCRHIARIAHEEGFQMVIVGVWELRDKDEVANALQSASYSDAYCLGHRGLNKRYNVDELESLMKAFRQQTNRPVTTSELLTDYETNSKLATLGDFFFPDAHSTWHQGQTPQAAWDETLALARRAAQVAANVNGKLVLMKMVSYPSGGATGLSQETQSQFYRLAVEESVDRNDIPASVSFSFLTAFDAIWKTKENEWQEAEQFTGLFTQDRKPKSAVTKVVWRKSH